MSSSNQPQKQTTAPRITKPTIVAIVAVVVVLLMAGAAYFVWSTGYGKLSCADFQKKARQLQFKNSKKEFLAYYKKNQSVCSSARLAKQQPDPESKNNPADTVGLYRDISFQALTAKDKKLSMDSAKTGLAVYKKLSKKQQESFEKSSVVLRDLHDLAEGKY